MYIWLIKKLENLLVVLMTSIVPLAVIILLMLLLFRGIPAGAVQNLFGNAGWNLLVFILFIKPISVILKKHFAPTYRKLPEGIVYLVKGRTQNPILIYVKNLIVNTIYSICLYGLKLRKRLGILVFWCILLHWLALEIMRFQQGAPWLITSTNLLVRTGGIGLIALLIGTLTSNMFSIKKLKRRRKPVQQVAYIAFLGACVHLYFFSRNGGYIDLMVLFVVLKVWERRPRKAQMPIQQSKPATPIPDGMKARIIYRKQLTDNVVEYTIEVHEELKVIPGQRVLLTLHDGEGYFNRSYSIVDYDVDQGSTLFVLAIKLIGGRGTTLWSNMRIGDELLLKGVYGKFVLQETTAPKVFIGTGTGLAPLINMAKRCEGKQKKLYYSVPYGKDVFYEDRLRDIHDLSYEIHTTREDVAGYTFGRLDIDKADISPQAEIYVCGNPKVVENIVLDLKTKGYQNIFSEKF